MDQGAACHCRHLLDGGHALSAAAVRLSLRGGMWLKAVRDLQGDGTAAAPGDHQSRDVLNLVGGVLSGLGRPLYSAPWFHAKFLLALILSGVHGFFARCVKDFGADRNRRSQKFYRIINEVPTTLIILIVILVIVKPFS